MHTGNSEALERCELEMENIIFTEQNLENVLCVEESLLTKQMW